MIKKVVIPAAGFGTRFLPQTKALPKEMLPIVDKPVIQYVVEEAVASGAKDIIIVTGAGKRAIEDHFDTPNADLINALLASKKDELIDEIINISDLANFIYIRQKGPYGNGTPVLSAEPIIGSEPFAVMWGDEFIISKPPRLKQMIEAWKKYGGVMISGVRIENKEDISRYGIADIEKVEDHIFQIKRIIEKPDQASAPSNLAAHGAYILPPQIFSALKKLKPGKNDEIWLVDGLNILRDQGIPIFCCEIKNAKYYDTGNKLEYMKTIVELALDHPEIGGEFAKFLKSQKLK